MTAAITDIWFTTGIELKELVSQLALDDPSYDVGEGWAWAAGTLLDFKLNIVQRAASGQLPPTTRIFLLDQELAFSRHFIQHIVARLKTLGITPVYCGSWKTSDGGEFTQHIIYTET